MLPYITICPSGSEAVSRHSKKTGLVNYLAFLAKVVELVSTAFKKY